MFCKRPRVAMIDILRKAAMVMVPRKLADYFETMAALRLVGSCVKNQWRSRLKIGAV